MDALPQRSWLRCDSSTLKASVFEGSPAISTSSAGDLHAVEGQLGLGGGVDPHPLVPPGDRHALPVGRHDHRADALGAVAAGPAAPDQHALGDVAQRRVVLVGVEPPAPGAVLDQRRPHVLHGRAGVGLGDPDADDRVAVGHRRQPALLHRLGAEVLDAPRRPVEGQLAADGRGHVGPRDLLEHDGGLDVAQAHAAPLLPHRDAEQVGRGQRLAQLGRHRAVLVGLVRPRRHLALGHVAGQLAQRRLVLGLGQQVVARPRASVRSSAELGADDADEADALARRAAQVVGQAEGPARPDGVDLAIRRRLAPQLEPALEEHAQARGADRMPEALQPPSGLTGRSPSRSKVPSSTSFQAVPRSANPRSSISTSSVGVKQSCTSAMASCARGSVIPACA